MSQLNRKQVSFDANNQNSDSVASFNGQSFCRGALVFGLVTALLGACAEAPQREVSDGSTNVQTEEVAGNTEGYIGQIVTIRSEPIEAVGDNSFTVSDERFLASEPILVINATGTPMALPEEDGLEVQVTGEVRNFVISEVDQEFDLTLDPATYEDYEDQPVIIAQSITLAPKPGEITADPEQYYGQTLAVTGEVEDIQGETTFTLDEDRLLGTDDLLVVYAQPKAGASSPEVAPPPTITDDEQVAVTGVLRPFIISELERDYDLTWDAGVQQQLEKDYSERPVLIATEIYQSAIPE